MGRFFLAAGGVAGAMAVAAGAVAAHALPASMDAAGLAAVRSAVQMQGWHALAQMGTGLWLIQAETPWARRLGSLAGIGFMVGMLLFCGAIYAHHLAGCRTGALAPIGGVTLILSWMVFAASALAG